jgi:phospholipid/cholesterol/gamma-HCH transport system substrate-binding protein
VNRHVPRGGAALLVLFVLVGVGLFLFFSANFGGPAVRTGSPFLLRAQVSDTEGLSVRSDVRLRGVLVGHVRTVQRRGGRVALTLALDGEPVTLRRGTSLRVGTKTALGESYVDLLPGPTGAPALRSGVELRASAIRPAVEVDEALRALDAPTRAHLQGALAQLGRGTASPRAADQVGGAVSGLRATVDRVHDAATLLQDQAGDLSQIVLGGGRVGDELARRSDRVRGLVRDGFRTLDAVGARDDALRETIDTAPGLLRSARATLRDGRPLIAEAQPVVSAVRQASPDLAAAAAAVPATSRDVDAILGRGRTLERAAAPVLAAAPGLLDAAGPAARRATPALANLTTIARWLEPRKRTVASWFSNTAAIGTNGDAKGRWARFFIFIDPATLLSQKSSMPTNAYTPPNDALNPQPFRAGDFERLLPAVPPPSP